ncbi:MAG TPA: hypothetical protein VH115_07155 [Solirubrobacteraceae bacterium]|nr:hypothetical protein [Solirubrobacteraceae bacterium]
MAAAEEPKATVTAEAPGASASGEASLSVADPGGKASELLSKLTISQLASLLKTTPAQVKSLIETATGGALGGVVGELLAKPGATLEEVKKLLAEGGLSSAPVEQAIAPLVATATETAGQVRGVVSSALADLSEDGGVAELAHELALPTPALEAPQLSPATVGQAAETLGTTAARLSSALLGAGAISQPLAGFSPLAMSSVERASTSAERVANNGTTLVIGSPTGTGGVTLTTVNSTSTPGGVAAFKGASPARASNAFSILSLKVTRAGTILEKVRLPGPGRVSAVASATKTLARRSSHGHALARRITVASTAANSSGGTLTLTLRPHGVSGARRTRITVATTYTPTGGSARTVTRVVTIGRRGSRQKG